MNIVQTDILVTLHRQGALTTGEIADWTGINEDRLPRILASMAKRNLIDYTFAHDCIDASLDFLWWTR